MRVLITGISGYLGFEMAHYFQERGHKVLALTTMNATNLIL